MITSIAIIAFAISILFVLYVLLGYPLALEVAARIRERPIRKSFEPKPITVVIPVRNGAVWIKPKLKSIFASHYPSELIQVLIVSDGSTDGTEAEVLAFGDKRIKLIRLPASGKATALNTAFERTDSELLVLTDVRQTFDAHALAKLLACFADPSVGVVTGELVIRAGLTQGEFNTGLYWKYEKWIRRNLNKLDAMLGATGSICAVRRLALAPIPSGTLLDDVYLPFASVAKGFRIYFEDQAKAYDLPTSLKSEFKRKVRTQAGLYQIMGNFPWLLSPFNHRFVHFVSHKLGRLLLPFALFSALLWSAWLPAPWNIIALGAQAAFYVAALADPFVSEDSMLKRLTAVIRAFLVLVAAAFCSLAIFFVPPQKLWKETKVRHTQENRIA